MKSGKKFLGMLLTAMLLLNLPITPVKANTVSDSFKVATYNIAAGRTPDIEAMNTALQNEEIDVVGVQEVDMNTSRNNYDMLQKFVDYGYFTDSHFQKAIDYGGGEYGIGLLSRYEFVEKTGASIVNEGGYEARAYARGVFEKDGKQVAIYNTHLTHESQSLRARQMQEVLDAMDKDPVPYKILTGDFNTDQDIKENYPLMKNYNTANGKDGIWYDTYGEEDSSMKVYCIDNVITSRNIKVNEVKMVETGLSDHNMLYIDCQLLDQEEPSTQLLDFILSDAKNINGSGYTEASYQALQDAIKIAEEINENNTQVEIDQAINSLETAMSELEELDVLENNIIPKPLEAYGAEGNFELNNDTVINVKGRTAEETEELAKTGEYIAAKFRVSTGYELPVVKDNESINNSIVIKTVDDEAQGEEGYKIKTTEAGVEITANQPAGAFMAVQTVRQLLPADIEKTELVEGVSWVIPCSS
ncbi:glycoside hydrolase family 20 zincin-like fold domain-containing protein, partial [Thomasclavelia spiroformis]|uniref:glycoside hydrolase family 20 zincin-like fold domain-containing protein n=1 Tax=Thomasclavelia spiroformis TaxID=29348 RepID=UPI00241EA576